MTGPLKKKARKSVVRLDSSLSNQGRPLKVRIISQREQNPLCRGAELGDTTSSLKKTGSGGYRIRWHLPWHLRAKAIREAAIPLHHS